MVYTLMLTDIIKSKLIFSKDSLSEILFSIKSSVTSAEV